MGKGKIIGIDLGTSNSVIAVMDGGKPMILENLLGGRITPSVVAFKDNNVIVGEPAVRQVETNPNTITSIKRLMGTNRTIKVGDRELRPEQISAMIISHLKNAAEEKLGQEVTEAVITVPAYFDDTQRKATIKAGKIAGLDVKKIINEPTAAALAYGFDKETNKNILVYDLGGGTFDVSVLQLRDGQFTVLATSGDNRLGGDDWDNKLVDFIFDEIYNEHHLDLRYEKLLRQRIKFAAEKAKKELSETHETTITLPFIANKDGKPIHFEKTINRKSFEELTKDLLEKTKQPVLDSLNDAHLTVKDIDEVLLVGGSTKMPAVKKMVEGVTHKKVNLSVNPDEVVALGAAIQGGVVRGDIKLMLLLDITPLTLGIETIGDQLTPIIPKNSPVPIKRKQVFSTAEDNQPHVEINIVQGDKPTASANRSLGRFILTGIEPAPKAVPKIEVTFSIDEDGIVSVTARDKKTGAKKSIKIKESVNYVDDEIKSMQESAAALEENVKSVKNKNKKFESTKNKISDTKKVIGNSFTKIFKK